jgi:hypothetical protein
MAIALIGHFCINANAQKIPSSDQFLYAVVELHQTENSSGYEVELKTAQVVFKKLRLPTRSEELIAGNNNYVKFQITDAAQNPLDEIIISDPFNVSYEYVDEEGNFKHTKVAQKTRSILIRRPITSSATNLMVQSGGTKRSNQSFNHKFR